MRHLHRVEGSLLAQKASGRGGAGWEQSRESQFVAAGRMVLPPASCPSFVVVAADHSFHAAGQGWDTCRERRIAEEALRHTVMLSALVSDLCRSSLLPHGLLVNSMGLKGRHSAAAGAVNYILRGSVDYMYWIGGLQAFDHSSEQQSKAWRAGRVMCLEIS